MVRLSSLAIAHVTCSFNNTIISITTVGGHTIVSSSGGAVGFKGHKRSTPYASLSVAKDLAKKAYYKGVRKLYVQLKGFGNGRKSCLKGFMAGKLNILEIKEVTAIPYNGCKASKQRRI
jgi:small subunit ribosomal protein S11|uniref:Ribosomal protein S11 n=1 Tax=Baffinella frigidus TaxID=2571260 RepID=A0A6C0X9W6_9CRYP|nr:ribosomal protein S11 [Cryptophyta sp. CCMP2293]|mmetsp:Transcript_43570/g.99141  ORF Transcript_43570/g.99141 Transcript_43570/m.99141 type:complete len:119 (+) Transcript_43570:68-424(+)